MGKGLAIGGAFAAIALVALAASSSHSHGGGAAPGQRTFSGADPLPPLPPGITPADLEDDDPRSPRYSPTSGANTLPLPNGITPRMLPPNDWRSAFYQGPPHVDPQPVGPQPPIPPPGVEPSNAPTLADLPQVPYARALLSGTATPAQLDDFLLNFEVDPAALYSWAMGGPLGGAAAMASSPANAQKMLERAKQAIAAEMGQAPAVSNQYAGGPEQYQFFTPNAAWPNYERPGPTSTIVVPAYTIDRAMRAPQPVGLTPAEQRAFQFYMNESADLASVLDYLAQLDARGLGDAAQGVASRLQAHFIVRALLGFAPPPIVIPQKYGGNPPATPPIGQGAPQQSPILRVNVPPLPSNIAPTQSQASAQVTQAAQSSQRANTSTSGRRRLRWRK